MNKKLLIMIAVLVVILTLVFVWFGALNAGNAPDNDQTSSNASTKSPDTSASVNTGESQITDSTENPTNSQVGSNNGSGDSKSEISKIIQFPYTIPGTSLVIEKIDSYDGVFIEDGSDADVTGITAMVLTNSGDTCAELAMITLTQGDNTLQFKVSALDAGCTVVVQELSAAKYQETPITSCTADVAELEHLEMSADMVEINENENGSLTVTNLTNETIPCVRVFYKYCMEPDSIYIGGITYTAKIIDLKPRTPQEISPSHYAAGYSDVIMVRTYETAD